jgi:hypothetical protein
MYLENRLTIKTLISQVQRQVEYPQFYLDFVIKSYNSTFLGMGGLACHPYKGVKWRRI